MHPIEASNYVIPTAAMERWFNAVRSWSGTNVLGGITPGRPRLGKSFAIRFLVDHHRNWFHGDVSVVSMEVVPHRMTSEKMFFGDALRTMGYPTTKADPEARRNLFVGRLVDGASQSARRSIIVIVDEGQNLDSFTLSLLSAVHNELVRNHKITCKWLIVGQEELGTIRQTLLAEGKRQLVARFMRGTLEFGGLCAKDDFGYCVACYDIMRYPEKHGPTYTEYYAPAAVAGGYLIESDAQLILETLQEQAAANGISPCNELSMEGFISVMNHLMIHQLPKLGVNQHLDVAMVRESVEAADWIGLEQEAFLADEARLS
ncbi:hypothetical protein DyAD56_17960 [Dyella sp. AD56]|uniref:ATP-binding protein n=1 Tax=Dyella sp. AD56 TaxID=1528744 RepID=UPI000C84EDA8|nr:ATP-binding protein [Dyella sp. AD56]PMQ03798.1 hypothetical protein DyAD56_17960 [Dyella sp. AD56]